MAHKSKPKQHEDTEREGRSAQAADSAGEASSLETPKQGDTYRCNGCGMELEITEDCNCTHPEAVHFQCCGAEMSPVR